jgi:hypothetical protein
MWKRPIIAIAGINTVADTNATTSHYHPFVVALLVNKNGEDRVPIIQIRPIGTLGNL